MLCVTPVTTLYSWTRHGKSKRAGKPPECAATEDQDTARQCGNQLMKQTIRTGTGGQQAYLSPHKAYCVLAPSKWLTFYMRQKEFDNLLECKLKHQEQHVSNRLDEVCHSGMEEFGRSF